MCALKCLEPTCEAKFTREFNLKRHFQKYHSGSQPVEKCFICGQIFNSCEELKIHLMKYHKPTRKFILVESAFKKAIVTLRYTFPETDLNFVQSQLGIKDLIKTTIINEAAKRTICKVSLIFVAQMSMIDHSGEKVTTCHIPFRSMCFNATASNNNNLSKNISKSFNQQAENLENFINNGSNWHFDRAFVFNIEISSLRPIVSGEDFDGEININKIKNSKELYNPKETGGECFLYCVARALIGGMKNLTNVKLKREIKKFNVKNIEFPISIKGVTKFVKQNPQLDIKINILLQKTNGEVFPYEFGLGHGSKSINLLMLQRKDSDESSVNHFLLILKVNNFLRKAYFDQNNKKQYQKAHFCLNCLNYFYTEVKLAEHLELCSLNKPRLERIPENTEIKFKNFENTQKLDYIGFLDFECALPNVQDICKVCDKIKCSCDASYTDIVSKQKAIGYSFIIMDGNSQIIHEKSHYGNNAAENFIEHLLEEENRWIKNVLSESHPIEITRDEQIEFDKTTNCYMCDASFLDNNVVKCRDHSHRTSKYLGAACQSCNLRRRRPKKLKIFAHNGSR